MTINTLQFNRFYTPRFASTASSDAGNLNVETRQRVDRLFKSIRELYPDLKLQAPRDYSIFQEALTHVSATQTQPPMAKKDYRRLEYLGDSVLNLACYRLLQKRLPDSPVKNISALWATVKSNSTLGALPVAELLMHAVIAASSERANMIRHGPKARADMMEAFIGAFYLDMEGEPSQRFEKIQDILDTLIPINAYFTDPYRPVHPSEKKLRANVINQIKSVLKKMDVPIPLNADNQRTYAESLEGHTSTSKHLYYLGDCVIKQVLAEALYQRFPDASDRNLIEMNAQVISGETIDPIAEDLNLQNGPRHVRYLMGALLVNGQFEKARDYLLQFTDPKLKQLKP